MKRIFFFIVGGLSLFAAVPIIDHILTDMHNLGYDKGLTVSECQAYNDGVISKKTFKLHMGSILNQSNDQEAVIEYLERMVDKPENSPIWLKCLEAVQEMKKR